MVFVLDNYDSFTLQPRPILGARWELRSKSAATIKLPWLKLRPCARNELWFHPARVHRGKRHQH